MAKSLKGVRRVALVSAALLAIVGGGFISTSLAATPTVINIGATVPLSGPLAGFGSFLKWGYQHAVNEVNAAGGIKVNGKSLKVKLTILDDKTDPNQVSAGIQSLISKNKVNALLGSCTPDLVNPGAVVADRKGVPFVTGCDPVQVFTSVKKWTWAWDLFFSVPELAALPFNTLKDTNSVTNKKIAIFHDNGPDGKIVGNEIWPGLAKANGYEVVENIEFPADNTDFSAAVQKGKASGADILLVDAITPPAISIRKQMAAAGWTPKVIVMEKGAEPVQFAQALGNLADGIMVGAYWDPSFSYPGAKSLQVAFEKETGQTSSQHIADSYSAAMVLMDAIKMAGSLDPKAINTAIGKTDKTYAVGPIKFAADHTSIIPVIESQWQSGKPVIVWPLKSKTGSFFFPIVAK